MIKLTESVTLDQYGQIACIPDYDDLRIEPLYLAYNNSATAIGFNYYSTAFSYIWAQFNQNIVYNTDCTDLYTNTTDYTQIICTRNKYLKISQMTKEIQELSLRKKKHWSP